MLSNDEISSLYDLYSAELFRYIRRFSCSHENAEDLLQELFIKFIKYSSSRQIKTENLRALLYSIARSVSLDDIKKRKHSKEEVSGNERIFDSADTRESSETTDPLIEFFNSIIDTLGEPERSIILMRKNGLTFEDISSAAHIPLRTVKRKTARALELMRNKYKLSSFFKNSGTNAPDSSLYKEGMK